MKITLALAWFNDGMQLNYIGDHGIAESWQKWLRRRPEVSSVTIENIHSRWEQGDVTIYFHHRDSESWPWPVKKTGKHIYYAQNSWPRCELWPEGTVGEIGNTRGQYDGYLFCSEGLRKACNDAYGIDGAVIPFATDPEVFFPQSIPSWTCNHPVVFVGNDIRPAESNEKFLIPAIDHWLAIYGGPYKDPRLQKCHRGKLPQTFLPLLYNSPTLHLNFHIPIAAECGIINSRVYDLLACGALVISEDTPAMRNTFGDYVFYTEGGHHLSNLLFCTRRVRRDHVPPMMAEHTWEKRMETLIAYLKGL